MLKNCTCRTQDDFINLFSHSSFVNICSPVISGGERCLMQTNIKLLNDLIVLLVMSMVIEKKFTLKIIITH